MENNRKSIVLLYLSRSYFSRKTRGRKKYAESLKSELCPLLKLLKK